MLAYIGTCRKELSKAEYGYVGMDAAMVSGHDVTLYAFEAPELQRA